MDYTPFARDGLLLSRHVRRHVDDSRSLTRGVDRGELVRLRRGAFVPTSIWSDASARERHILRIRAVLAAAERPIVVCGESAAALWGMPLAGDWPDVVSVLDEWRGGGRAEPGVRRTAAGFRSAKIVELDGFRVTDLARTALDVARRTSFANAIGSVDWSLSRRNDRAVSAETLFDDALNFDARLGRRHLQRVVGFASPLSDSFGESMCRAVIHLQGFERPELQVEFRDSEGAMYPDFFWRSMGGAAEFDGKQKYTRNEFTAGDPGDVVWREKKREDRLRRQVSGVTRLLTNDVMNSDRLSARLTALGVPRGGRS
jgi:hypothetical protein